MKKKFAEPEMVRIDLKMTECIASSEQYGEAGYGELPFTVATRQYVTDCQKYYVTTTIEPYNNIYSDVNELAYHIAMGSCFKSAADKARALSMYGLR